MDLVHWSVSAMPRTATQALTYVGARRARKKVSLPNGARSFPPALLEQLEQFTTIYIWCDDDVPGREGADMCVKKLGRHRCRVVTSRGGLSQGPKDANEVLQALEALRSRHAEELATLEVRDGPEADAMRQRQAEEAAILLERHPSSQGLIREEVSKNLSELSSHTQKQGGNPPSKGHLSSNTKKQRGNPHWPRFACPDKPQNLK